MERLTPSRHLCSPLRTTTLCLQVSTIKITLQTPSSAFCLPPMTDLTKHMLGKPSSATTNRTTTQHHSRAAQHRTNRRHIRSNHRASPSSASSFETCPRTAHAHSFASSTPPRPLSLPSILSCVSSTPTLRDHAYRPPDPSRWCCATWMV